MTGESVIPEERIVTPELELGVSFTPRDEAALHAATLALLETAWTDLYLTPQGKRTARQYREISTLQVMLDP